MFNVIELKVTFLRLTFNKHVKPMFCAGWLRVMKYFQYSMSKTSLNLRTILFGASHDIGCLLEDCSISIANALG